MSVTIEKQVFLRISYNLYYVFATNQRCFENCGSIR